MNSFVCVVFQVGNKLKYNPNLLEINEHKVFSSSSTPSSSIGEIIRNRPMISWIRGQFAGRKATASKVATPVVALPKPTNEEEDEENEYDNMEPINPYK
jgi:hypothetical protein